MNRITDYKKLSEDIVNWIHKYATDNNIQSLVVGVSGGIDSAVVATLCARTGLPTWLTLIAINSNKKHMKIAHDHCETMDDIGHVHIMAFELSAVYTKLSRIAIIDKFIDSHTAANMKARLRMTTLYTIASQCNGIVVGTGNKVEDFGIGFFTKYGDGGVDISPIADLYKTEVRELGRYLGVSEEIINAQPTDGLWEDCRDDETQIGCTYEELEWAMEMFKSSWEYGQSFSERQTKILGIYNRLHNNNQHKMQPIPIYKLTI